MKKNAKSKFTYTYLNISETSCQPICYDLPIHVFAQRANIGKIMIEESYTLILLVGCYVLWERHSWITFWISLKRNHGIAYLKQSSKLRQPSNSFWYKFGTFLPLLSKLEPFFSFCLQWNVILTPLSLFVMHGMYGVWRSK